MNTTLKVILIVLVALVVGAALFFAGYAIGRPGVFVSRVIGPAYPSENEYYAFGPGMMQQWDGPGMMRTWRGRGIGPGMMRSGRQGCALGPGMMQCFAWGGPGAINTDLLTVDQTRQAAEDYLDDLGIDSLEAGEVMIFENHAYVVVEETDTGLGAFELLVDPLSKWAYPEHGPNMMWNLKYGAVNHRNMMGARRMMPFWQGQNVDPEDVSSEMPVTPEDARSAAQQFLDRYKSGATASEVPTQFYGYYTFDFEQDGKVAGMLSVNGFNEQVFPHVWHGTFVEEAE